MPIQQKLTILFLAANPASTEPLQLDEEVRAVDNALRWSEFRDRFDLRSHWAVRFSDLQELLLRYQPQIVHFSGHGSAVSELALTTDKGQVQRLSSEALASLFSVLKVNVRCVVLNACYTESQAEGIASSIDFVVGTTRQISDTAAIDFAAAFYGGLGYGRTVKTAFELGCIRIENIGESATPQLIALHSDPEKVTLVEVMAGISIGTTSTVSGKEAITQGDDIASVAKGVATEGDMSGGIGMSRSAEGSSQSSSSALRPTSKLTKLNGQQFSQLQKALLSAFDMASLTQMVKIQLDQNLSAIVGGSNLNSTVFDLISWAQRTGNLDRLIDGALAENPSNPELLHFVNKALRG